MPWEMSLKKRLVNCDRLQAGNFGFAFESDDPIDQQERITMRQNLHHFVGSETAFSGRKWVRRRHRAPSCLLARQCPRQFRVSAMTGFNRNHMTPNAVTDQRKVANDIENLVPNEFIGETKRFLA